MPRYSLTWLLISVRPRIFPDVLNGYAYPIGGEWRGSCQMINSISPASMIVFSLSIFIVGCSSVPPSNLGIKDGCLAPCPATPNCVSSQSSDREHAVRPFIYSSSRAEAVADLKKIILPMKRARIVSETGDYIHVEFTSAIWRFVDDVEFYFDDAARVIHVRSASRMGRSDFGVNRKRVEEMRSAWKALGK